MLNKLFDTLANMGIWIRLNDTRADPPPEQGRAWGRAVEEFALSLEAVDPDGLSVLIKNLGATDKRVSVPGWLNYFQVEIAGPDGSSVPLKRYGERVLDDPRQSAVSPRKFPAGKSVAAEIPLGALYDLKAPGMYRVRVSCPVPGSANGATLVSNEVLLPVN
jgi:hypothetical protein